MPPAGVILDWWNCRPDWLSGVDENSDVFISELNHFAEVSAAKYGPKIKYWMIGNELSGLHWNGRYSPHAVLLYKNVSAAVKRGWPDAQVGTRLAFDDWDENITNWAPFLDEVKGSSDWVGVQAYPVGAGFHPGDHALKQAIEMVRKRSGGLPVWVTETGVSLCQCERRGAPINSYKECMKGNESCQQWVTEERRGIWMRELIHDAWDANAFGISVYTWSLDTYSLIDQETYWEKDYGFKPLPVLEVFRQAYAELQTLQE
jgi:hypothetical protein